MPAQGVGGVPHPHPARLMPSPRPRPRRTLRACARRVRRPLFGSPAADPRDKPVIPARIEESVTDAVAHRLKTELGDRGLLLSADHLAAAEVEAARTGARLLGRVIERCYPVAGQVGAPVIEFESERQAARLASALAFGAVTARVLVPGRRELEPSLELLCSVFNLGIGLVDGVCDVDAETGGALLELLQGQDLIDAAGEPRERGWLRAGLPPALEADHAVAFAVDIIETFFETLHAFRSGDASLPHRREVGTQLEAALEAERQSVIRSPEGSGQRLMDCSRLTSVMPFQIIETLAGGSEEAGDRSAASLLGEAMWRIDDLVDLCQDARSGAVNGLLLAATQGAGRDVVAVLERLLSSTGIAAAARQAANDLLAALHAAGGGRRADVQDDQPSRSFLYFVQQYAGIAPRQTS